MSKRQCRFEMYRDRNREWRWRFRARNGKITASSAGDGYKRPGACRKAIDRHVAEAGATAFPPIMNMETGVVFHEGMDDN